MSGFHLELCSTSLEEVFSFVILILVILCCDFSQEGSCDFSQEVVWFITLPIVIRLSFHLLWFTSLSKYHFSVKHFIQLEIVRSLTHNLSHRNLLLAQQNHFSAQSELIKQNKSFCLSVRLLSNNTILGITQYHWLKINEFQTAHHVHSAIRQPC